MNLDMSTETEIRGRRLFETNDKFYFTDIGLRNAVIGFRPGDAGQILENVVFHHLRSRGFRVRVGLVDGREVDFVAEKNGQTSYYQAAYLLSDAATVEREFGNLEKIPDNYPKYVVSMDPMAGGERNGIANLPLREFLLQTE